MASRVTKGAVLFSLIANLLMYSIVLVIAAWALNKSINHTYQLPSIGVPVAYTPFSVYMGNQATIFLIMFALIASVVGAGSCLSGIRDVSHWRAETLIATSSSATTAWGLTLLAMGCACKEIWLGGRNNPLKTLEALVIVLGVSQLVYIAMIHVAYFDLVMNTRSTTTQRAHVTTTAAATV